MASNAPLALDGEILTGLLADNAGRMFRANWRPANSIIRGRLPEGQVSRFQEPVLILITVHARRAPPTSPKAVGADVERIDIVRVLPLSPSFMAARTYGGR